MKKLLIILAALAIIAGVGVMKVEAAEDTITVTVTLRNVAVEITVGDPWALPTMVGGTTSSAQLCTAKNTGNVAEKFNIKVGNSSPTGWTPAAAADANKFVMTLVATGPLIGTDTELAASVGAGSTKDFSLTFTAPTSSSGTDPYAQQSITVTVSASV